MAAAAPHGLANPNPSLRLRTPPAGALRRLPPLVPVGASARSRRGAVAAGLVISSSARTPVPGFQARRRRLLSLVPLAAPGEESRNAESASNGIEDDKVDAEKAWKLALESFKENALKMQSVSQEAFEEFSKKAVVILEETSKSMKIQADKASRDIAVIMTEISEEGREYLSAAAKNPPDSVKDIVEIFSTDPVEFSDISKVRDFHIGIPYGALLAIGGFVSFMFTGSTSAIRFGIILGSALLTLSLSSLRSYKKGRTSGLLLKGQAALATIIFVREWRLLFQKRSLPAFLLTIISGAALAFYIYRIVLYRRSKGQSSDHASYD